MKRGLQIVLAILSLIPLVFAIKGLTGGAAGFNGGEAVSASLNNQFLYFSAFYLSLTFVMWHMIPNIEKHGKIFRLLVLAIFLGGLARAFSYATHGAPSPDLVLGMALELGAPLLILWQAKVAKAA